MSLLIDRMELLEMQDEEDAPDISDPLFPIDMTKAQVYYQRPTKETTLRVGRMK